MKVFISSLISGLQPIRNAAKDAITTLRHEPVMAEDFGAQPNSPQIACLTGLRQADAVVLILGENYGSVQSSLDISATHEEYKEAKGQKPIFAFVQTGVHPDIRQTNFINEVQGWEAGLFRGSFSTAAELQVAITRALHDYELANAVGPLNQEELVTRVLALMPSSRQSSFSNAPSLTLAVAGGPTQSILRPIEIENPELKDKLHSEAMFGSFRIFNQEDGFSHTIEDQSLSLQQGRNGACISLDELGSVSIKLPITHDGYMPVLIEENIQAQLLQAIGYSAWLMDHTDPTQKLTHVAIAARIQASGYTGWKSQRQQDSSPNRSSVSLSRSDEQPAIYLNKPRAALRLDAHRISEDLLVPLRRQWRG